jgi:methionyl-tRNA formyltransferase
LHDSILPKYRGFAPLVNSLINKEKEIGVTALFSTDKYDEGEIIFQEKIEIVYPIRINDAIKIIAKLYSEIVIKLLTEIFFNRKLESYPQNNHHATYSLWRDENDYMVDWNKDAESILQFIYSVGYPYQGAITSIQNGEKFRILECELVDDVKIENRDSGKIIFKENLYPIVVCKTGLLKLTRLVYEENGKDALADLKFRVKFS